MATPMIDVSIIIVNWNTRDLLRTCLLSLPGADSGLGIEVCVVDNASTDGSAEMVAAEFPQVELIANDTNTGFVFANNQAAKRAQGRYALLLNSDTRLLGADINAVIEYLDEHPEVGVASGEMRDQSGKPTPPYRRFPGFASSVIQHTLRRVKSVDTRRQRRARYDELDPRTSHDVDWLSGAYLYVRREVMTDDMIFEPSIFMYYEDTLLCKRAWDMGYKVRYLPLAPLVHHGNESAKKVIAVTALYSYQSSEIYIRSVYGTAVGGLYRMCVHAGWWFLRAVFRLLPHSRSAEKYEMFTYFIQQDRRA